MFMKKNCFFVVLCVCLAFSAYAAGGRQSAEASSSSGEKPVLTVTCIYYSAESPDSAAFNEQLEKITGYKTQITWIPFSGYEEKTNTMLASDTLTQVMVALNTKTTPYLNAVDDGVFWDLTDYIKDYPNIAKLGDARFNNVKRNGRVWAIPRSRDLVRQGTIYRQDWAEELGFKDQPKTVADIDRMIRGFAARQGSSFGMVEASQGAQYPDGVNYIALWLGAPLNYGFAKNGEFTANWLTSEFQQSLDMFRTWYADGVMNKNFVEVNRNDRYKPINLEQAGFIFAYADDINNRFADLGIKNPNARLWYSLETNGRTFATSGYNGAFVVSKSAAKTEALFRHSLSFIDALGKPEWQQIARSGLEGEHYSMVGGFATRTTEQNNRYTNTGSGYSHLNPFGSVFRNPLPTKEIPAIEAINAERLKYVDTCITDPTIPFTSETQVKFAPELDPIKGDAINRYIMGVIDLAGYRAEQQKWLNAGGTQVIKEFGDQVKANR
jgi:putative aldouronate transport system substrate-binding protein